VEFDVFFSISQTPVAGRTPSEAEMFRNFFAEVEAADRLGFGTAWIAESHLSTATQKQHPHAVVPHWQGEIGLNADPFQLAHKVFARTERIECGSAVMNLLCNGGPVAAAERAAAFCALHGADPAERRRLHLGFSQGRFDFMNRAHGIAPRNATETVAWPALKGKVFAEACEIFLRLLRGEELASDQVRRTTLCRNSFRSEDDWERARVAAAQDGLLAADGACIEIARRWDFDVLKIVPQEWRRELLQLVIGSHDQVLQEDVNRLLPVQVFNLSITRPEVIDATHARMARAYHPDGGPWRRSCMPRTVFVFLNAEAGLAPAARRAAARDEAKAALGAYWTALEGTLDPKKVANAADNALIGDADEVAAQIVARFHPEDRLMLWFDFFNHDAARVVRAMEAFQTQVAPRVRAALVARAPR